MDKVKIIREEFNDEKQIFDLESYKENLFNEKGYLYGIRSNAFKTFQNKILPTSTFSLNECGFFYKTCCLFLNGEDNILCTVENKTIVPVTIEKIMKRIDLKRRTIYAYLKKFIEHGVFREITIKNVNGSDTSFLLVNPIYAMKTKRISLILFIAFQYELKQQLPPYAIEKFNEIMDKLENKPIFKKNNYLNK